MPSFEISAPNGKTYHVEGENAEGALAALQQMHAAEPDTTPSTAMDVLKSAGVGVGKGAIGLMGLFGDASNLGAAGIEKASNYVSDKLGIERYKPPMDRSQSILNKIPTSADIQGAIENNVTRKFYEPQTTAGRYAQSAGEFLPSAAIGPGGPIAKIVSAIGGGLGSEAAGDYTKGSELEPYARIAGGIVGGLAPAGLSRAITPNPISPARQRLVNILNDEGVTSVTAGQRTGNDSLKYAETFLGDAPGAGRQAQQVMHQGQEQFTEAAMRRAGTGPDASPEVLAQNQARLGQNFNDLAARNNLNPDNQFITDITDAVRHYRRVPDSQQRAMVQGYVDDIIDHVNAGNMPGPQYQEMRSRLSRQSNSMRQSDPTLSEALRDMRNALDNAMQRSIPAGSDDAALWQQTRREYGAQKLLEKAASRAGEATGEGQIVPANLRNAIPKAGGGYARGEGDFTDLARAGATVMQPLPNSGSAHRISLLNILNQATLGAVPATAGRVIMSRPVQSYLGNQVLPAVGGSRGTDAVVNALMALQGDEKPKRIYIRSDGARAVQGR